MTDELISRDALVDVLTAYDGIASWSSDQIDAGVIAAASGGRAKIIANFGVGVDHIDVAAARIAGIAVTNTPGVLTDATADLTMTLMLMTARRTGDGERFVACRSMAWWQANPDDGEVFTRQDPGHYRYGPDRAGRCAARGAWI